MKQAMTKPDFDFTKLDALREKASKGPWAMARAKFKIDGEFDYAITSDKFENWPGPKCIAETFGRAGPDIRPDAEANAAFIVAIENEYPALRAMAEGYEEMLGALKDLVSAITRCHDDEGFRTVWTISQLHIGPYAGPQYVNEFQAAKAVLAKAQAQSNGDT